LALLAPSAGAAVIMNNGAPSGLVGSSDIQEPNNVVVLYDNITVPANEDWVINGITTTVNDPDGGLLDGYGTFNEPSPLYFRFAKNLATGFPGSDGTTVAANSLTPTYTPIGGSNYTVFADLAGTGIPSITLTPGDYWLGLAFFVTNLTYGSNASLAAAGTTDQLNAVDDNLSDVYIQGTGVIGIGKDVSFQLLGTTVPTPEPASAALVAFIAGAASMTLRRSRK
jgi:hypothetical protein